MRAHATLCALGVSLALAGEARPQGAPPDELRDIGPHNEALIRLASAVVSHATEGRDGAARARDVLCPELARRSAFLQESARESLVSTAVVGAERDAATLATAVRGDLPEQVTHARTFCEALRGGLCEALPEATAATVFDVPLGQRSLGAALETARRALGACLPPTPQPERPERAATLLGGVLAPLGGSWRSTIHQEMPVLELSASFGTRRLLVAPRLTVGWAAGEVRLGQLTFASTNYLASVGVGLSTGVLRWSGGALFVGGDLSVGWLARELDTSAAPWAARSSGAATVFSAAGRVDVRARITRDGPLFFQGSVVAGVRGLAPSDDGVALAGMVSASVGVGLYF